MMGCLCVPLDPPHPEEAAFAAVSKDAAASWFETRRFATLLTMRF
jgi:hypothetical protein